MSTILPPVPNSQAGQMQTTLQMLSIANGDSATTDALAGLPSGTVLQAVVQPPQQGQPINLLDLSTAAGPLALRNPSGIALPTGTTLALQITQTEAGPSVRLVAVNGHALTPTLQGMGQGSAPGTTAALMATVANSGDPAAPGMAAMADAGGLDTAAIPTGGLTATLLRPAGAGADPTASLPPGVTTDMAPGTQLTVRIASVTPDAGTTAVANAPPQQGPAPTLAPPAPAAAPGLPAAGSGADASGDPDSEVIIFASLSISTRIYQYPP